MSLVRIKICFFLIVVFILSLFFKSFFKINSIDISLVNTGPLFYFLLGSFIGINKFIPDWKVNKGLVILLFIIWLVANVVYINLKEIDESFKVLFLHFKNLIGIIALWQLYDITVISQKENAFYYKYSFFIFAFHGLPIAYLGQVLQLKLPDTPLFHFIIYLFFFVLVLLIAILLAYLTDKYLNRLYLVLTGSR
jgi:hypothetical protein